MSCAHRPCTTSSELQDVVVGDSMSTLTASAPPRVMHVSQPALSKRLHSLESLTGVPLLMRSHHGVSLTPAGTRFYPAARRVLTENETITELIFSFQVIARDYG